LRATLTGFQGALHISRRPLHLCLHQPGIAPHQRDQLLEWVSELDLHPHVTINPLGDEFATIEQLNELYNCCDIGVNTSHGEGWGLISFEHAASGAAQIVPKHSAPGSIWGDAALFLEKTESCFIPNNPFRMYHVSTRDMTRHLVALANDREYLRQWQESAMTHAHRPDFKWSVIADTWHAFLEQLQ
ncbi:MAG: glycosyltransferase, partial [Saprospiraceae bacterium]|nr:glycosyltransferase [Saprospiraceae bacterium]